MGDSFLAKVVTIQRNEDVFLVGFADDPIETRKYLMFQKSLNVHEDASLGMNGVYVELCDQSRSAYGGIKEVLIGRSQVSVEFGAEAREGMKVEGVIHVDLSAADYQRDELEGALKEMFEGEASVLSTE